MHALLGGLQNRPRECDCRALTIGSRHVDYRGKAGLWGSKIGQQALDASERKVNTSGMQRRKSRRYGIGQGQNWTPKAAMRREKNYAAVLPGDFAKILQSRAKTLRICGLGTTISTIPCASRNSAR